MLNVYKHSHFSADAFGHGGNKRTAQVTELLKRSGIAFHEANFSNSVATRNKLSPYLTGIGYSRSFSTNSKNKYAIGRYIKLFERFIEINKPELLLWESTSGYNSLLAEILHKNNIPVVGLPHNIESLVTGSKSMFSNKESPDWLFEELKYLAYCENVFTISREERWLLSNAGIAASYLPYYPTVELEKYLLNIRSEKQRLNKPLKNKKDILLLGTFYNKPTFDGYVALLRHIKHQKSFQINVAGFGSELLENMFPGENIRVWGSVSNQTLQELIIRADLGVVHQQASSGFLTRIPEMVLAGIPLLVNEDAARSSADIRGVNIYRTFEELSMLLNDKVPEMPPVLQRPVEETFFTNFVKAKIDRGA